MWRRAGSGSHIEHQSRAEEARAAIYFERSCAAEQARCCKHQQVQFFETMPSHLSELSSGAYKGSCGNLELYIYIFRFIQELKGPLKRLHPLPLSLCQAPSFSFSLWGATSFRLTHSSYRATHSGYGATPVLCQGGNLYVDW